MVNNKLFDFKKLFNGVANGDLNVIRNESKTYYKNKKKNLPSGMDMGINMKKRSQELEESNLILNSLMNLFHHY